MSSADCLLEVFEQTVIASFPFAPALPKISLPFDNHKHRGRLDVITRKSVCHFSSPSSLLLQLHLQPEIVVGWARSFAPPTSHNTTRDFLSSDPIQITFLPVFCLGQKGFRSIQTRSHRCRPTIYQQSHQRQVSQQPVTLGWNSAHTLLVSQTYRTSTQDGISPAECRPCSGYSWYPEPQGGADSCRRE